MINCLVGYGGSFLTPDIFTSLLDDMVLYLLPLIVVSLKVLGSQREPREVTGDTR